MKSRTRWAVVSLSLIIPAGTGILSARPAAAPMAPAATAAPIAAAPSINAESPATTSAAPQTPVADLFLKEPYLIYPGDPTRMQVLWQLTAAATSTVEWGADTSCTDGTVLTTEYGSDHQHTRTLTGLTPGQHYFYRVTVQGVRHPGSFNAAPAGATGRLKFFAYGDTRSDPASHNSVASAMTAAWTSDPEFQSVAISVGDLVGNGTNETDWTTQFFTPAYAGLRSFMAQIPYMSCIGNHEGTGNLFIKYFPYPFVGGRYWSFDYGPAHFVMVDQYTSYAAGSAQLQWITDDLASTTKPWKFICLHEPGWSAGSHANNVGVQTVLQPLCVQYGVSIVFAGHNHYYCRAEVGGVRHITTGGGGAPLYQPVAGSPNVVASAKAYHYCEIEINGADMSFRALKPDGTVIDSFSIHQTSAVPPVDTTGPITRASPNPFSKVTQIRWLANGVRGEHLVIVDASGRLVRMIPSTGAGMQTTTWDGTDSQGRPAAPGVYYFSAGPASAPRDSTARTGRVVLVR